MHKHCEILCFHFSWRRSPKLMLVVWLLTAIIFNTLYVSEIVALLVFSVYQGQPRTFKQLLESHGFSWRFDHSEGNLFAHFKSSSNPVFQQVFAKMGNESDTTLTKNFACITWTGVSDFRLLYLQELDITT